MASQALEQGAALLQDISNVKRDVRLPCAYDPTKHSDTVLSEQQATVAELKGVFHQLKSREQMLDMLQQNKPPTADGVAASEAALKEAKATNRELQKRCETAVGTMQAQAADIGAALQDLSGAQAELEAALKELAAMEKEAEDAAAADTSESTPAAADAADDDVAMDGTSEERCETVEDCEAKLAQQVQSIEELTMTANTLQDEVMELEDKLQDQTAQLRPLKDKAAALEHIMREHDKAEQSGKDTLSHMAEWYTSLTASLSACLGIHVLHDASDAEGALRLKLLPGIVGPDVDEFEGDEHVECGQAAILEGGTAEPARTLVITTTQRRSGTDVVIVPQSATLSPADVEISDIVAAARASCSVPMLVEEVQSRLNCYTARRQHLAVLRKRYTTSYTPRAATVTFTLPAAVAVTVRLSHDYPKPSASIYITRLDGIGHWKDSELATIRREFNAKYFSSAVVLGDVLQAHLAKLHSDDVSSNTQGMDAVMKALTSSAQ